MKTIKSLAIFTLGLFFLSIGTASAEYPEKPITVVVSFAAGGNADIGTRIAAEAISGELGAPINVVNKPGGAHIPAVMSVVEAPADGYTIIQFAPPSFMVVPLTRDVPYSPAEDFTFLWAGAIASNALYVRADSPWNTFEEFLDAAKADKLTMGVNNLGAPPNLSAVQLANEFGLEFKTIALKTVPASITGLIGEQVDVAVGQIATINAFKDQIKPLIILDNDRKEFFETHLPGVRTVGEAFPGKEAGAWVRGGWAVRKDTPQDIVDKLVAASAVVGTEEFMQSLPPGIDWSYAQGQEAVLGELQKGIDLYSPILDGLGLLHKK
ncbi:MAG: tripartite tricarboxylate transporter substrate binding protein [Granulosicoccus sp.]|nr:tripartite tricarboxylate transporter substrate binding protein [Granulosicoccus sp.]